MPYEGDRVLALWRRLIWLLLLPLILQCTRRDAGQEWQMYSADFAGSKYSPLDQIHVDNVNSLKLAWRYQCGDARDNNGSTIQCNPIMVGGRLYITSPALQLIALEATSGAEHWSFDPYQGAKPSGVSRGVTHWRGPNGSRIYYGTGPHLYCLDAVTGDLLRSFGEDGVVDLAQGLGRDITGLWIRANTPGMIYQDLLILGCQVGEGPGRSVPGYIRAFDLHTGEVRWVFHTIPHPGEPGYETWSPNSWQEVGGANSWGGFTLDEERGLVFCGTGSASYDHWGGNRVGDNLYANCVLALEAGSGELRWHYQVVHHDIWDYDIPCPPNLVQVNRDGRIIDAVAQPTKMGHLFVLDRETGVPIFPVTERPVPQSTIPGEVTSPTQPFPPTSLVYAQQRFTAEEATDISPEENQYVREKLSNMTTGDIFLPPGTKPSVTLPQFNGGTDWGGAAYHPAKRMLYVNCSNESEWISMVAASSQEEMTSLAFGRKIYQTLCGSCHGYQQAQMSGSPALPQLRDSLTAKGVAALRVTLTSGTGQMPAFGHLSDVEIEAVLSFLAEEDEGGVVSGDILKKYESIPWIATGHNVIKTPRGLPINQRPWGTLSAIDLDAGEIRWQVPLGTYPQLEAAGFGPTGTFNMGGPIATSGDLIFIAAAMDERLHAYHQDTGELLWEYQLDAGGYATPSTYMIDGKQYVIIAAGGGGKPGTKSGDKYYCFSLPPAE